MASGAEQEQDFSGEGSDPFTADAIDGDLLAGMPDDDRFGSGVPDGQRANSLDFIQMSGLTRAPIRDGAPAVSEPEDSVSDDDLNPAAPLSFYEKGVSDVDDGNDGGAGGLSDVSLDSNLVPDRGSDTLRGSAPAPSSSVDAFKDIVAGLESGFPEPPDDVRTTTPLASPAEVPAEPEEESSPSADLLALLEQIEEVSAQPEEPTGDPATPSTPDGPAEPVPEADGSLTDDWDSLLDSVAEGVNAIEEAPAEEPASTPAPPEASPKVPSREALAEAEQLMQTLGKRPPQEATAPTTPAAPAPSLLPTYSATSPTSVDMDADLSYDYSAAPARRRSKRHTRGGRRAGKVVRMIVLLVVLIGGVVAGYVYVVAPVLQRAEDLEVKASRLMKEGKYPEASRAYDSLAHKVGADPVAAADAQFRAAYALTLGDIRSRDEMRRRYTAAVERFATFIQENPLHRKRTRAETIMGRLYYELGDYDKAIDMLRDQADPANDPQAALTMLRYLARAYSQKSEYEAAESAYLQAAFLPGNYTVDEDFRSLGELYKIRADLATSDANRDAFMETAATYWQRAIQVPGIEPSMKAELQKNLEWLSYEESDAGTDEANPVMPSDVENVPDTPVAAPEATPETMSGEMMSEPGVESREENAADEYPAVMTTPEPAEASEGNAEATEAAPAQ